MGKEGGLLNPQAVSVSRVHHLLYLFAAWMWASCSPASRLRGSGRPRDDEALMCSAVGARRPPYLRARGPRTQVTLGWYHTPAHRRRCLTRAGGLRTQVTAWVVSHTCASAQWSYAGQRPAHLDECVGQKLSVAGTGSLSVFRCWCLGDSQQRILKPFSDPRFCFTPKLLHYGIRARDVVIRWLDHANSALDQSVT